MLLAMESCDAPLNPDSLLEHAAWIRRLTFKLVQDPGTSLPASRLRGSRSPS